MSAITLSKEAAVRQREALRLLTEENNELRDQLENAKKEAAARQQLSKEAAARVAGALVTAGYVRAADQAKTASLTEQNPEALLDIVEQMAADRAAPPSVGAPDGQAKMASAQQKETADEVWNRGPWGESRM